MAEAAEIDIELAAEAPPPGDDLIIADVPERREVAPEEGIEALKAALKAEQDDKAREKARAETAEAEARRHAEAASRAQGEKQDTEVQLVSNAVTNLKSAQDTLKGRLAEALSVADHNAAAEIQLEMSGNAAKLITLENGLEHLKSAPKPKPQETTGDPAERLARNLEANGGGKSAQWVRSHPEFASGSKYDMMIGAHHIAMGQGHELESAGYFAAVEKALGIGTAETGADASALSEASGAAQRRQSPPPSAPPSRGGNGGGSGPTTVRLSQDEREAAYLAFPDVSRADAERTYARNKLDLQREGKLH